MGPYRHPVHAGNPGDVWKHLILGEAAAYLLDGVGLYRYAESHCGEPEHQLQPGGQWQGGIGRLWPRRAELGEFPYLRILQEMNQEDLALYPGSATLVHRLARERGLSLALFLYDTSPDVARAWERWLHRPEGGIELEQRDGFSGAEETLPLGDGLLLIDSTYQVSEDVFRSEELFASALDWGWDVLCWYPADLKRHPKFSAKARLLELDFFWAGLEGGRWSGAVMAAGGRVDLLDHLEMRAGLFLAICGR